tara:strand:+ start:417 stop:695 length:279 start_codon:yes stop_codon:yes gene_type:complete
MAHLFHILLTAIGLKKRLFSGDFFPESERRKQVEYLRKLCALLLVDGWGDFDSALEAAIVSLVVSIESPERVQQEYAQASDHYNEMWGAWVQ